MTTATLATAGESRRLSRSAAAVFIGFVTVVVLSLGTDEVLHLLNVYPAWGQPMFDPGLNFLALSYRCVFTVFAGYLTARLAPRAPVGHALILGIIGTVFGTAGAIATITQYDMGPDWYPILLAVTALPCCWLGGKFFEKRRA